jgi:hypothetical protein
MISTRRGSVRGVAFVGLIIALVTGCATTEQPALVDAKLVPAKVSPGEKTLVQVKLVDPQGIVSIVVATVREFPQISFDLKDNGENGDAVAGDGIWSYAMQVPSIAPPGEYTWDLEAYDAAVNPVTVTRESGETVPLTAEATGEVL